MPDCPNCGERLAICTSGCACLKCKRSYPPREVVKMPGYDWPTVKKGLEIYLLLDLTGLLDEGVTEVDVFDDALIIQKLGVPD